MMVSLTTLTHSEPVNHNDTHMARNQGFSQGFSPPVEINTLSSLLELGEGEKGGRVQMVV